jgi:hypothetical protein
MPKTRAGTKQTEPAKSFRPRDLIVPTAEPLSPIVLLVFHLAPEAPQGWFVRRTKRTFILGVRALPSAPLAPHLQGGYAGSGMR